MIKTLARLKTAVGKLLQVLKLSHRGAITPDEARRRAAQHVMDDQMFKDARVADGAKVRLNLGYTVGPTPKWSAKDVWVVYKNSNDRPTFRSSEVVLVCKRTGQVLYEGSAGDEG